MNIPGPAAEQAVVPSVAMGDVEIILFAVLALTLTGFFALLRAALLHSVPSRLLQTARSDSERARLQPLLGRAEKLATSANILEIAGEIFFVIFVLAACGGDITPKSIGLVLLVSVPVLALATEVVPNALRGERSDRLLSTALPFFDILQRPLAAVILTLEAVRRFVMRVFRVPERAPSARTIVEGIREVIEESTREGDLEESEREIIENVVEFHDVDVTEVMTPRTEVTAVEVDEGVRAVIGAMAKSGHSRIPVYRKNLDTIIGTAFAQQVLQLVDDDTCDSMHLGDLLQPVDFVPETKLVSELLNEFRGLKRKMAIVLDEYGGTAGIVTSGDIIAELVGEVQEDIGEPTPDPIRRRTDGAVEIAASVRVSEVNEELDLHLPEEEDYETIAGFVLSQLGRFPKAGESFEWQGLEITIMDANDRRVLEVLLRAPTVMRTDSSSA